MNLLLFDVDGTLTDTSADDDRLFRESLLEALPADARPMDIPPWETFAEVTDPAIAREVITRACARPAREAEIMIVRRTFIKKFLEALDTGAITIRPMPGALEIIAAARQRPKFVVALATGGWGPTTILKLTAAGFPVDELVIATADDSETRCGILNTAAIIAAAKRGVPGFTTRVVVGDGVWDGWAAEKTRAGFVGVTAEKEHAMRLRSAGAGAIVPDFQPPEPFWAAVTTALTQRRAAGSN